ncbi:MAG TPA: multifunctional oxoglutarate decarboxylase/oxoglutarate dehydrogenase thiamine pyrophosphate-binding subunit/dihydrolipoyllysine-residue succinyltransferase subunit [Candidatus Limnocylindrales bacterium]|nr:multifunctional oxoglutarate decarboxylase/oxoglutarate dehydrogenase thiamine pyrophosphate-binding subunit/dihydrolipoyllysine-residue succinyltransferase subunit [Candidatus Limnocylindrales bacterium]
MPRTTLQVTLPEMGESITEGTVAKWLKDVGDAVRQGEGLVEVTTDKVDAEVPAPASGRLRAIIAHAGETVTVGAPLAEIEVGADGDGATAPAATPPAPRPAAAPPEPRAATPAPDAAPAPPAPAVSTPAVHATEGAELLARARGIDLAQVMGSGEGGQIRRRDVARAIDDRDRAQSRTPAATEPAPPVPQERPVPAQPLTGSIPMRGPHAALVKYMEESLQIPTATSFRTVRVDVLDQRRRQLNQGIQAQGRPEKLSYTHLVAWAIIRAVKEMPGMAVAFDRVDGVPTRVARGIHLGLAVDVQRQDGSRMLIVPVIHDADRLDFAAFRDQYETLVARARSGKLSTADITGASIVLTNPGGIGTVASVPRLLKGQGTIVAAGAIGYPPEFASMPESGLRQLGVSKVMTLTSTYDHRVIQGAESGEFLRRLDELLGGADSFYESAFEAMRVPVPAGVVSAAASTGASAGAIAAAPTEEAELLRAVAAGTALVSAYRSHGHLAARLDPLGSAPPGDPSLDPLNHGLTPALMEAVPAAVLRVRVPGENLAEVLVHLRETYCSTIAYEIEHISSHEQRNWLREKIESGRYRQPLSPERKLQLLQRLTKVEAMERYLRRAFLGQKTFSIEGLDSMIVMLEEAIQLLAEDGTRQVVMGMAHRGRLGVIAHVVNRPYESILVEFEAAKERGTRDGDVTGDVKYHAEAEGTYVTPTGKQVSVTLLANPSHLEAVDPVVEGWTRAQQSRRKGASLHLDQTATVPVLIHGDAAFPAQGVVAEVFNLDKLEGYSTGGTLHLIANNQLGFTTDPEEGRSTRYASDLAKGFDAPIVHVNADDITACVAAVRLAVAFRRKFGRDVVIDLIGYRRFGHNEADEPGYTQPLMYEAIKQHPPVRERFAAELIEEGLLTPEESQARVAAVEARLAEAHASVKARAARVPETAQRSMETTPESDIKTAVSPDSLESLNRQLYTVPAGFTVHPKLSKQMERRKAPLEGREIDWAQAEELAFASLITGGIPVRLAGQDTERGTFSQRHMVFHDPNTGARWAPIQHLVGASATFELHNSPLSEYAALGFEYGYSTQAPDALVCWEAQYGDFTNGAQIIVDQFIVSGLAKWGQSSRLTLLLPHGYEGSGPEHSSARLERFLQLAAEGNIRVAYPTTAAQYFHLLRREALHSRPRPLILMTPKSLLRLKASLSRLQDLTAGGFKRLIDDPLVSDREQVRRLLLCTGKIYYDLALHPARAGLQDLAIVRLELLEPLRVDDVLATLAAYPNVTEVTWVQEEPMNMGAFWHVRRRLEPRLPDGIELGYVGRPERASPSEGYAGAHQAQQERIVEAALGASTG